MLKKMLDMDPPTGPGGQGQRPPAIRSERHLGVATEIEIHPTGKPERTTTDIDEEVSLLAQTPYPKTISRMKTQRRPKQDAIHFQTHMIKHMAADPESPQHPGP
jgi:hypothetical protein